MIFAVSIYYGDPGTHYTYSRREYNPLPWLPELLSLKARVEEATPLAGGVPPTFVEVDQGFILF